MSKCYLVAGLINQMDSLNLDEIGNFIAKFKTKEEAEQARDLLENHYSERCKVDCFFEVREIEEDTTLEELKRDLDEEYEACYAEDL